jgi:transcriptional regulator with XRE-family HTH domain
MQGIFMEIKKKIGKKVKHIRVEHELTQFEMAKKIGANPRAVGEWETGKRMMSTEFMYKICDAFGLSMSYFDLPKEETIAVTMGC